MPPTPAQLLRTVDGADRFLDPTILQVLDQLRALGLVTELPDRAVTAIAALGTSSKIVKSLVDSGALHRGLTPNERQRFYARTGITDEGLRSGKVPQSAYPEVASFLGLPNVEADQPRPLPDRAHAGYPLFPHQRRALREVISTGKDGRPVLLHMPTGSGKTRTAMNVVCDYLRRQEGKAIIWVATMKELLQQAADEFVRAWSYLGDRDGVNVVHAYDSNPWSLNEIGDSVIFATPQTLRLRAQQMASDTQASLYPLLSEKASLLVFDEAHQASATTYTDLLRRVAEASYPPVPVLGLSATPGRTYFQSDEDYALIDLFDSNKVTLDTSESGYSNPVDYLIGSGYLAEPEFRIMGDLDPARKTSPMSAPDYLQFVTEAVLRLVTDGHTRIIVFSRSVEESELTASILRAAGVSSWAVSGTTPNDERDSVTREYKSGVPEPRVLVNFGVFTAGFDAPKTSAVVIARPVRSLVAYSQMVGRGIRGPKAGGNTRAVIATVVDPSEPAYGSIAEAFKNWDEMWSGE